MGAYVAAAAQRGDARPGHLTLLRTTWRSVCRSRARLGLGGGGGGASGMSIAGFMPMPPVSVSVSPRSIAAAPTRPEVDGSLPLLCALAARSARGDRRGRLVGRKRTIATARSQGVFFAHSGPSRAGTGTSRSPDKYQPHRPVQGEARGGQESSRSPHKRC